MKTEAKPVETLVFEPEADITAYELAILVNQLFRILCRGISGGASTGGITTTGMPREFPPEMARHFKPTKTSS